MNRKMKQAVFCGVVILVFAVSSVAYAQPYEEGPYGNEGKQMRERKGKMFEKIAEELNLTDEQKEQLKANREEHRAQMKETRKALRGKRQVLKGSFGSATTDGGQIRGIANEVKSLQGQLVDQRVDKILETKSILTPEQFEKMQSIHKERKEKRKERGGQKSGRGFRKKDHRGKEGY